MMNATFTHEVGDDPVPRRRVRISGPVYDDSNVQLLRVEYEDGAAEFVSQVALRQFRSPDTGGLRRAPRRDTACGAVWGAARAALWHKRSLPHAGRRLSESSTIPLPRGTRDTANGVNARLASPDDRPAADIVIMRTVPW
jgi:hypothetical protein